MTTTTKKEEEFEEKKDEEEKRTRGERREKTFIGFGEKNGAVLVFRRDDD